LMVGTIDFIYNNDYLFIYLIGQISIQVNASCFAGQSCFR
jgi:hypothetical protein